MATKSVYFIPGGPKNIASLFPAINMRNVVEYFIEAKNTDGTVVATTTTYVNNCCCPEDKIRIHFLNYLGTFDAINFQKPHIIHDDSSTEYQNALSYPLQKQNTGIERFNVKGNDTYEALVLCTEPEMGWIQELADSPKMFLEWKGIEGQADDYLPIVKIADKFDKLKNQNDFQYQYTIQFKLSNQFITVRN